MSVPHTSRKNTRPLPVSSSDPRLWGEREGTMTITVVTAAALLMAAGAQGKSGTERQVTVYLNNSNIVPVFARVQAEALASKMFAGIGVTLNLREARTPAADAAAITIKFVDNTPDGLLPLAWAYALPYEGVHIRIFWDRMERESGSHQLLAHVMVHEITHILQAVDGHSAEGIMNARWTKQERLALESRPLCFTAVDVDLIYQGMDARGARGLKAAGQALVAMPLKAASISAVQ
jgi:hypothetical protein